MKILSHHPLNKTIVRLVVTLAILLLDTPRFVHAQSTAQTESSGLVRPERSPADSLITLWQGKIANDRGDFRGYNHLTLAYIQKARETGDISYYDLAEKTLKIEQEQTHPDPAKLASIEASIHFAKHEFAEAGEEAQRALKLNPDYVNVYGTLGDAYLEQGEYDKALAAYRKLSVYGEYDYQHRGYRYIYLVRMAHYKFLTGSVTESDDLLRAANKIAETLELDREGKAWTEMILADQLFIEGDLSGADTALNGSLNYYSTFHRAYAVRAKVRAAQGNYPEAIAYYKQAIAVVPLPIYAASLGDLYARTGDMKDARKQYDLVEFIAKISALSQVVYNRELALFYADHDIHLPLALQLAQAETKVRKDVYTWDTLSWTLFKNGRNVEAVEAMNKAMLVGTLDPMLFFHAGLIYLKAGDQRQGREYLEKALAINPQFHPLFADQARTTLADTNRAASTQTASSKTP